MIDKTTIPPRDIATYWQSGKGDNKIQYEVASSYFPSIKMPEHIYNFIPSPILYDNVILKS